MDPLQPYPDPEQREALLEHLAARAGGASLRAALELPRPSSGGKS